MPLNEKILFSNLKLIFEKNNPEDIISVADKWSNIYNHYASNANAGSLIPTNLNKNLIKSSILLNKFNFFVGLSQGLRLYWLSSLWSAPGFTGIIPVIQDLMIDLLPTTINLLNNKTITQEESCQIISSKLHIYTKKIVVLSTNISSGVTSPLPIT